MSETISLRYIFLKGEDFYFRKRIPLVLMEDTLPPGPDQVPTGMGMARAPLAEVLVCQETNE